MYTNVLLAEISLKKDIIVTIVNVSINANGKLNSFSLLVWQVSIYTLHHE